MLMAPCLLSQSRIILGLDSGEICEVWSTNFTGGSLTGGTTYINAFDGSLTTAALTIEEAGNPVIYNIPDTLLGKQLTGYFYGDGAASKFIFKQRII